MKVNQFTNTNIMASSPNFRANYFVLQKYGDEMDLESISSDNEENLGSEPVLEYRTTSGNTYTRPMTYDGKYYVSERGQSLNNLSGYRIFYKDTGNYERGGKEQVINPMAFVKTANQFDRVYNNLPSERAIGKGEAKGKVFVNTFDIPEDVPAILILDELDHEFIIHEKIPNNVKGLITAACSYSTLEHATNRLRNNFSMVSVVLDEDKFNRLKELEGQNISVNNESGFVEYNEMTPVSVEEVPEEPEKVEVPKLEHVDRFLDFDELTPQNCGNKGYRLGVMQRLSEEGKLKDITIPNGFVIPEGYLNQLKELFNIENEDERDCSMYDSIYAQEISDKCEQLGLGNNVIVRSNFNTEDRRSFSSAGIYESKTHNIPEFALPSVYDVVNSKDSSIAKFTHDKHGIEEGQIQPSVIVQKQIPSDVYFTVYSDDGGGNTLFDLGTFYNGKISSGTFVRYNKKTKEFNVIQNENKRAKYLFNEKGEIIDHQHNTYRDIDVDKIIPMLKTVAEGAMVLEDYFDYPQDIEGGIDDDGKVYFWQTRDIVAKGKKKI